MTVARLDRELGPDELTYWEAYLQHEGTTSRQNWLQTATVRAELRHLRTGNDVRLTDVMPADPWTDDGHT